MLGFQASDSQGGLLNPVDRDAKTLELRKLLSMVDDDEATDSTLIPVGTGMLIATHH
jgi:predicted O-methyltransferase YrrM